MTTTIPNSIIGAVSCVPAEHYQSHSTLDVHVYGEWFSGRCARRKLQNEVHQLAFRRRNVDSTVDLILVLD